MNLQSHLQAHLPSHKRQQLKVILGTNPMEDDIHVGIRTVKDIKTAQEVLSIDYSPTKDWDLEDVREALQTGRVTVYSSKEIKPGGFVTPSKSIAQDYGNGTTYKLNVSINDIAWIDEFEGQYAPVN